MKVLVGTTYCGNIQYYSLLKNAEEVLLDVHEHFEKQSYRNRACVHGANGLLKLIIPLNRRGIRVPVKDVTINNDEAWQKLHWRSLESAYRSSPYFEYYEHDLKPFFEKEYDSLVAFNLDLQEKIIQLLGLSVTVNLTDSYKKDHEGYVDYRKLIHPKSSSDNSYPENRYMQVFEDRNGFIENLSILDLLFNEGPNSISFL